jgi:hypothetical protein
MFVIEIEKVVIIANPIMDIKSNCKLMPGRLLSDKNKYTLGVL